jgi:hypothetical protein
MSDSEVADLLLALRSGALSLNEVAARFRSRVWTDERRPVPQSFRDLSVAAQQDPDPEVPGSFDDVVAAYDRGEITREQYRTLVEAAAESIRAEHASGSDSAGESSE